MTTTTYPEVTADDIKALKTVARSKSRVDAYLLAEAGEYVTHPGQTALVTLGVTERREGYEGELTKFYKIPATSKIENYGGARREAKRYVASQTHYYFSGTHSVLRSLANVLRPGDRLIVHFVLSNHTAYLSDAGLEHDQCFITVVRNEQEFASFLLADLIAPASSVLMSDHSKFL